MNKVIIMGRLTKQPEVQYAQSGTALCKFSIAVDTGYGDNKHTSFFNCVSFKKTAENIAQYFSKGQRILVDGSLKQNVWEKEGEKKYSVDLIVFSYDFIESKDKNLTECNKNVQVEEEQPIFPAENPFSGDDIPF